MKIQVLGSGCPTCKKLFDLTKEAAKQLHLCDTVEYSTDVSQIIEMGVMSSPVLAIDGKAVMVGFVPDIEKIKKILLTKASVSQRHCKKGNDGCGNDGDSQPKTDISCRCGGNC